METGIGRRVQTMIKVTNIIHFTQHETCGTGFFYFLCEIRQERTSRNKLCCFKLRAFVERQCEIKKTVTESNIGNLYEIFENQKKERIK